MKKVTIVWAILTIIACFLLGLLEHFGGHNTWGLSFLIAGVSYFAGVLAALIYTKATS